MKLFAGAVGAMVLAGLTITPVATAEPVREACSAPAVGEDFQRRSPESMGVDPAALHDALDYASAHARFSIQVVRDNCLIGEGQYNQYSVDQQWQLFSATKGIVSLVAGAAWDQGKLDLDAPIGTYLPEGMGDEAHRAITVRQLLTQTSGLLESLPLEALTLGNDPSLPRQAMSLPIVREPGTDFQYSQRAADLVAYVVGQAVGEDIQAFAQRELFGPIGIAEGSYNWSRDRSGNTYGYAHMFMQPKDFAKIGALLASDGVWNGQRVLSSEYITKLGESSPQNGCYSLLLWTNAGDTCVGPAFPIEEVVGHRMIPSAPADLFALNGAMHQNVFVMPNLGMSVTWTGLEASQSTSSNPANSELYHEFFRILMRGVEDANVPDPGPFMPGPTLSRTPGDMFDLRVLESGIAPK